MVHLRRTLAGLAVVGCLVASSPPARAQSSVQQVQDAALEATATQIYADVDDVRAQVDQLALHVSSIRQAQYILLVAGGVTVAAFALQRR